VGRTRRNPSARKPREPGKGKLLQIVIASQQELDRKLDAPEFRQLKQRISLRAPCAVFELAETVAYVNSRMARAGLKTRR